MTPKTQYQKMRDNRARRESMLTNADEFEPLSDTHINGVRFKTGSLWDPARPMVATLEDGSTLTASGPVWYPDDSGEWVEVPDDCMKCPIEPSTKVFVLLRCDRIKKERYGLSYAAGRWRWDVHPSLPGRIVAFKVVA